MKLYLPLAILAIAVSSPCETFSPVANPGARRAVSLDGKWRTIVDPYETG